MSFYISPEHLESIKNKDSNSQSSFTPDSNTGGTSDNSHQTATHTIFNNHGVTLRLPTELEPLLPELDILRRIDAPEKAAFIDTVSITFKSKAYYQAFPDSIAITDDGSDIVADISMRLDEILGFGATSKRERGINNYKNAYDLGNDWGHLAIGGIFQRDSIQIYLNGQGCLSAKKGWENRLFDYATKVDGKITRIDLAHDIFDGSYSVDKALESHIAGEFKMKNAPFNLKGEQRGNWNYKALGLENDGRTYYIGSRESGKLFRIYEKGFEQAKALKKHKETAEIFKNQFEQWVRIELELGNQNRTIPLDVLLHPAQYLAGSAPALEFISEAQSRIKVIKKKVKSTVENAKVWIKQQFGKWLFAFQQLECTNENEIVDDQKLLNLVKSLMVSKMPDSLKMPHYEESAKQMDFINFSDKQEDETEQDFIDRTFPIIASAMNKSVNSSNKRAIRAKNQNVEGWENNVFVGF